MSQFAAWFQNSGAILAQNRATDAWGRIQRHPATITIVRQATDLPAQTVRLEFESRPSELEGAAGKAAKLACTVFGVQGHPTITDTDIQADDRFAMTIAGKSTVFVVRRIITPPGEVQAFCESM